MEEQEGGDAVDWREAFDDLLVFEQDFDTAMQILMFQDEKVARLSLEEPSLTMRRTGRRAKSRTSARSSSKKRRRTEASEAAREEPPIPPLGSCTQSSGLWSSVANSAEEEEATQAPWTQQYSSVEMQEYAAPQFDEAYEDVGAPGTGETGGKPSETGRNARVNGAATTAVSSSDGANREKGNSSVVTNPHHANRCHTMASTLFTTGSGKAVSVSKVRLQAYEAKLRSEEEMVAASTTSERRDVHGAGGGVNAKADSAATVPSLFQTGSGKAVSVSKVRLQAYEAKLRSEEEMVAASTTSERRDVHGAGGGVNAKADSAATVPSLFQTGSGKAVSVSKVRLQAYEAKLRSEEEMVAASTTSERRDVHGAGGGVNAKADSAATVPSLFQTGSGKAVSVSKVRLQAYEAKLRSEEEMVAASTTSERRDVHGAGGGVNAKADSAATVPSLFQTGSGKAVSVSKVQLQAYEAKLRSEEEPMSDEGRGAGSLAGAVDQ
uniref:Uncharacterized protein n=1 Tax=Phytophthora ramorum TaxID=164328 RepID=H3GI82_PHYRM